MNFKRFACAIILIAATLNSCHLGMPLVAEKDRPRVLIVGGGSSHDFNKWYKEVDAATLRKYGQARVTYTDRVDSIIPYLKQIDVLYLATNQDIKSPATRQAIFDFADAGHGLILGHPALWYNWLDWPEYNLKLVGGGAKAHDKYGSFEEIVVNKNHPVTQGLQYKITLKDERYHYVHDPKAAEIEELINNTAIGSGDVYRSVFIVQHPKARIVCIALGHDAGSHETVFYQTLLRNAVKWAAGK